MSREDGFQVADIDSGYFEDAKMRDLWQRLHDPDQMARATCLHASTLLASWRQGERVTVTQACPLWLTVDPALVAALKSAKLLDKTGRIPLDAFVQWFGAAFSRRDIRREAGRTGGQASGRARSTDGQRLVKQPFKLPSTDAEPDRPSVRPTVKPTETRASFDGPGDGLQSLLASWSVLGVPLSPKLTIRLDGLVEDHGEAKVRAALETIHATGARTAGEYVLGACNYLQPIPSPDNAAARKAAADLEQERLVAKTLADYNPADVWYPHEATK